MTNHIKHLENVVEELKKPGMPTTKVSQAISAMEMMLFSLKEQEKRLDKLEKNNA